jgi:hypothetical protein
MFEPVAVSRSIAGFKPASAMRPLRVRIRKRGIAMKRLRVRTLLLVAGVAGIGLVARMGFAGHGTAVPSYTGCLNPNSGTFVSVAPGNAPLSACGASQIQVHLSGGDITRVVAGSGLTGGATEGVATLQVDQSTIPTGITAGFGLEGGGTGGDITLAVDPTKVRREFSTPAIWDSVDVRS